MIDTNDSSKRMRKDELRLKREELNLHKAEILMPILHMPYVTDEMRTVLVQEIYHLVTGHELPCVSHKEPEDDERDEDTEKFYTAEELGKMFGVSPEEINDIAQDNGLIPECGTSNEYGAWVRKKRINNNHCKVCQCKG